MSTTLKTAVTDYLRAGTLAHEPRRNTRRRSISGSNGEPEFRSKNLGARRSGSFWTGSTLKQLPRKVPIPVAPPIRLGRICEPSLPGHGIRI